MMTTSTKPKRAARNPNSNLAIVITLADTTWRMAIPTLVLAGLGIAADLKLGTKPWLTLLGTLIGFGLASLLIRLQLRSNE